MPPLRYFLRKFPNEEYLYFFEITELSPNDIIELQENYNIDLNKNVKARNWITDINFIRILNPHLAFVIIFSDKEFIEITNLSNLNQYIDIAKNNYSNPYPSYLNDDYLKDKLITFEE